MRQQWRHNLKGLGDLERLTARLALEQALPREVAAVGQALERLPRLRALLAGNLPPLLAALAGDLENLEDLGALISRALADDPPANLQSGGIIREGYDPELDELLQLGREGKDWIARLEGEERARSGINSLKIRYKIGRASCRERV